MQGRLVARDSSGEHSALPMLSLTYARTASLAMICLANNTSSHLSLKSPRLNLAGGKSNE
jgi:hypothetical protein